MNLFFRAWNRFVLVNIRRLKVYFGTRHVFGERKVVLASNQVMCVSMLKDAEYYIDELIRHHFEIGASHILIIDNGSTDRTVEFASKYPRVSVCRNYLPVRSYEVLIRSIAAKKYTVGGWFLFVDSDELFVVPASAGDIKTVVDYCNSYGFTSVVCQVLDFFSEQSLQDSAGWSYADSLQRFNRFSVNNITKFDYFDERIKFGFFLLNNVCVSNDVRFYFGGMRNEVFGENCCLTTHRLVKNSPEVVLYSHPHCSGNVRCADFTALIKHYKFCGDYLEREKRLHSAGVWEHKEVGQRVEYFNSVDESTICVSEFHLYRDIELLFDLGFLVASDRYLSFAGLASRGSDC